jgi:hypothetical protein
MKYVNYDDLARLEYGRLLWRDPVSRERLVRHWSDGRHPHRDRFLRERAVIEEALAFEGDDRVLDERLREKGKSLRTVMRDIPPVFGAFY